MADQQQTDPPADPPADPQQTDPPADPPADPLEQLGAMIRTAVSEELAPLREELKSWRDAKPPRRSSPSSKQPAPPAPAAPKPLLDQLGDWLRGTS